MTIYIIIIFFLLAKLEISNAQVITGYGAKLGIISSYHSIYGMNGNGSTNNKLGFRTLLFCDFLNLKYLFIRTEFGFVKKGAELSDVYPDTSSRTTNISTTIYYITFSPTANFKTNFKYVNFNLLAGPKIDILINYDENILKGLYDNINKIDYGLILGFGVNATITKHLSVLSEFRYDYDISKFIVSGYSIGNKHTIFADGSSFSNKNVELLIGFILKIK